MRSPPIALVAFGPSASRPPVTPPCALTFPPAGTAAAHLVIRPGSRRGSLQSGWHLSGWRRSQGACRSRCWASASAVFSPARHSQTAPLSRSWFSGVHPVPGAHSCARRVPSRAFSPGGTRGRVIWISRRCRRAGSRPADSSSAPKRWRIWLHFSRSHRRRACAGCSCSSAMGLR